MIVRILGEGQWDVAESHLDALNDLDSQLESAVADGDRDAFRHALEELLNAVQTAGEQLPDDSLLHSDLVLPPADADLEEVREMLAEDGLIPG